METQSDRSLFARETDAPLAARLRPRSLDEFVGQEDVLGPGRWLRRAIESDRLHSLILWGPPGTGKSTLAAVVANVTRNAFEPFSAVTGGVPDLRLIIARAKERRFRGVKTIVFVDEIHRFNKAQQDALLPHVEDGTITLIGATTENPFFEVNPPLLSRARLVRFNSLDDDAIRSLVERAIADEERGLGEMRIVMEPAAMEHMVNLANGDARIALSALEAVADAVEPGSDGRRTVTLSDMEEALQRRMLPSDKSGDAHYDAISAFIKSMRGSDPDATAYWFLRMLESGEDPRFLMRRILIHAAEDVGMADPQALVVAASAAHALEMVGLPEARIPMMEAALYIACAPKSNSVVTTIAKVLEDLKSERVQPVPSHLRDASYKGAKALGHGAGYQYPHSFEGGIVEQRYLPPGLPTGEPYYTPGDRGFEARVKKRMDEIRAELEQRGGATDSDGPPA
ncbi:MAG TPA: replication-associated recombination protein A [Armatimonadota bacterium]|jgi:putative ATPase